MCIECHTRPALSRGGGYYRKQCNYCRHKKMVTCPTCGTVFEGTKTYCSRQCQPKQEPTSRDACKKCGKEMPGARCRFCYAEQVREKRKNGNGTIRRADRARNYRRKYGITIDDYDRMFQEQNGCCALCGRKDAGTNRLAHFAVDHCHETGKIRGLLCYPCNVALGTLGDSPQSIEKVLTYLTR